MTYGITSESQLIDISAINAGCDIIDAAAGDFTDCGNAVKAAAYYCGKDAMSVDGKSMGPSVEELGTSIAGIKDSITSVTAEIKSLASQIYDSQKQELDAYVAEQQRLHDEEIAKMEASKQANNGG